MLLFLLIGGVITRQIKYAHIGCSGIGCVKKALRNMNDARTLSDELAALHHFSELPQRTLHLLVRVK